MKKQLRKTLVRAGRMSTAVDRIKRAFERPPRAKIKYDQLVEGMARNA